MGRKVLGTIREYFSAPRLFSEYEVLPNDHKKAMWIAVYLHKKGVSVGVAKLWQEFLYGAFRTALPSKKGLFYVVF